MTAQAIVGLFEGGGILQRNNCALTRSSIPFKINALFLYIPFLAGELNSLRVFTWQSTEILAQEDAQK